MTKQFILLVSGTILPEIHYLLAINQAVCKQLSPSNLNN